MGRALLWCGAAIVAFGIIAGVELKHFSSFDTSMLPQEALYRISLDDVTIQVRVADTAEKQQHGLSNTDSLATNQGMLFVFPQDGKYAFWMKDMKYALDILWLNANGRIVHIEQNVKPASFPATYGGSVSARYVLELSSGFVSAVIHFFPIFCLKTGSTITVRLLN
jgi:uncharacterized membrane protein (UPF0127 family)